MLKAQIQQRPHKGEQGFKGGRGQGSLPCGCKAKYRSTKTWKKCHSCCSDERKPTDLRTLSSFFSSVGFLSNGIGLPQRGLKCGSKTFAIARTGRLGSWVWFQTHATKTGGFPFIYRVELVLFRNITEQHFTGDYGWCTQTQVDHRTWKLQGGGSCSLVLSFTNPRLEYQWCWEQTGQPAVKGIASDTSVTFLRCIVLCEPKKGHATPHVNMEKFTCE